MDGPAFNGTDIIDRHAQPKVRDNLVQEEPLELGLDGVEEGAAQQVRRHRQVMLNQAQREHRPSIHRRGTFPRSLIRRRRTFPRT